MSEQPEALRLADAIISARDLMWHRDAAAELRRLHAECDALRSELCEQKRIASNEHAEADRLRAECDALRSELATLRAQNYETQSLLNSAKAEWSGRRMAQRHDPARLLRGEGDAGYWAESGADISPDNADITARHCYQMADAMLKAREAKE